jgi:outer membrane protein TolC
MSLRQASEARLDVGLSNKLDVYRAQLAESQAEQSAVQAETALENAVDQFRFLLGLAPDEAVEPESGPIPSATAEDLDPVDTLVALALTLRLDLLETRDEIDDAKRTAALSRQNLLPDLALSLRFTEQRGSGPTGPFAVTNRRWESFLSASLPIERAADVAQLQLSNLRVTAAERTYEQRRYEVENEVRATHRELLSLLRSMTTQSGAVEIAEQQLRLANLRYQRGLASNFDVVDAEGSLLAARSALVQLQAAYQVGRLDLERTVGRLDTAPEPEP